MGALARLCCYFTLEHTMNTHRIKKMTLFPQGAVYDEVPSPVGVLTIITSVEGLHAILWESDRENSSYTEMIADLDKSSHNPIIQETKKQLREYFDGKRKIFNLPLAPSGTEFQRQAWQQLLNIPYGKTISYAEQAEKIGNKNKARAVGMANGRNPISIIIPCHRVIGSKGDLVGFGGGLDKKTFLLELERNADF